MDDELKELIEVCNSITRYEASLTNLREERRKLLIEARTKKVTARRLSDVLGMSEQNVHKIVKGK